MGQRDAAGNLTADGSFTYQWDAESRLQSLNTTGATYTYDANGMRVRKQSSSETTEYMYFGGQPIAERDASNGDWSDYIYAGGRRLARADNFEYRVRTYGTYCSSCPWQWSIFWFQNAGGLNGYVIQPGDKLYLRQWQTIGARGGPGLWFTDGSYTGNVTYDQDGQVSNGDTWLTSWHHRRIDLTPVVGKTVNGAGLITEGWTPPGYWEIYYQDIALVSADGTVRPLYSHQKTLSLTVSGSSESTRGYAVDRSTGAGAWPQVTTTYYHGDHLGSSRMMTAYEGYPVWEATYLPYGQLHGPSPSSLAPNHYLFTGKERDPESGLDYFGARFYASAQGRFLSPDPDNAGSLEEDPQRWNAYSYARNNPLLYTDPDGLDVRICIDGEECYDLKDWQYEALLKAQQGKQGITLPEGRFPSGDILCGGKKCGTAQYFEQALADDYVIPAVLGAVAGAVRAGIRGLVSAGASNAGKEAAASAAAATASAAGRGTGQVLIQGTKAAVREALDSGIVNSAQRAIIKNELRRAAAQHQIVIEKLADGTVRMLREVPGRAGGRARAIYETVMDATGKLVSVVQKGYDKAGNLVHVDPKFP